MRKRLKYFFVFLLLLSLFFNAFFLLRTIGFFGISGNSVSLIDAQIQPGELDINAGNNILHYSGLRQILNEEISKYNSTGGEVGIYVQDAKTGAWLGINEKEGFAPASLLKVPVMMAVLKKAERQEINLNDKITIAKSDLNSGWGDLYEKGAGYKMSIMGFIEDMIIFSDNTAKNVLMRQITAAETDAVFVHVGISDPYLAGNEQIVSPRDYTRILKSLYYSTYLSPKYSEMALELMRDTREESLIPQGVPSEILVSHKFGIFEPTNSLHDCGIVYHPQNPYFICVMTRGIDFSKSRELIPKISNDVYQYITEKS